MPDPADDSVLLEIITRNKTLADDVKQRSGLLLKENMAQAEPNRGVVYAIGREVSRNFNMLKVGDTVIFKTDDVFETRAFKWEDKKLVKVKEPEIIAIINV